MKGLLFTREMASAVCAGRKTETRRVIVPQPPAHEGWTSIHQAEDLTWFAQGPEGDQQSLRCDYEPGERRCLLTTWAVHRQMDGLKPLDLDPYDPDTPDAYRGFWHAGLATPKPADFGKLRPGRFVPNHLRHLMPALEITAVRAERVQDITEEGAIAEGVTLRGMTRHDNEARIEFAALWDSINGKRGYRLDANPWVWVVSFRRVQP